MAGLKYKLQGATLIETLVALTLISTAIILSFSSVLSINKSFNNDLRTYAYLTVDKYINECDSLASGETVVDCVSFNLLIKKELYENNSNLYIISITAVSKDSIMLARMKEIKVIDYSKCRRDNGHRDD